MKAQILKRSSNIAGTIKTSLAMVIPILFIGSIAVLLNSFPVQGKAVCCIRDISTARLSTGTRLYQQGRNKA